MLGTFVRIVDTIGGLADKTTHQKAVDELVESEIRFPCRVASAITTVTPYESNVIRVTTIVFAPFHG